MKTYILSFVAAFLALVAPLGPIVAVVLFAIFLDTTTGIWKAYRVKEVITSRRLRSTVEKLFIYLGGLVLFYFVDMYILKDTFAVFEDRPMLLTKCLAIVFVGIEGWSINENYKTVTGVNVFKHFQVIFNKWKEVKAIFRK